MQAFQWANHAGLGMISGAVSGFRECWDFDDPDVYAAFLASADACGVGDVVRRIESGYCDQTPAGGRRWIVQYPDTVEWRDVTLARRPGRTGEPPVKTLIEMPQHAILAPSTGKVHPSGRPYVHLSGSFTTIANYTVEERDALLALARSFDEMPRVTHDERPTKLHPATGELRPGDDYARRTQWTEILEPHGWSAVGRRGEVTSWRRPGKTFGVSGTTNIAATDLLYVFSSSTTFDPERSYSKFAAYALLNHGGDFSVAAMTLSKQGYGSRPEPQEHNTKSTAASTSPSAQQAAGQALGAVVVRVSDVKSERVGWLWRRRIACGKLTLLMGDPGVGKSFITIDVTSRVTRGAAWPDGGSVPAPANVLFLAVEDGIADTIKPRLERAGADVERVFVFQTIREERGERLPDFERDMAVLEEQIVRLQPALVVVDPVSSYLGKSDSYKDADMRRVLAPLAVVAERHNVAVLALVHMTKGSKDGKALYRAMGSIAFAALARIVLAAGSDPEQPERCYLMPVKQNICPASDTLAYQLRSDSEDADGAARLEWEGAPVEGVRADVILGAGASVGDREQQQDAAEFLRQLLADGRMRSEDVFSAGKDQGYSASTLNRSKVRAGSKSYKEGFRGAWFWELESKISPKISKIPIFPDLTTLGGNVAVSANESTTSSKIVTDRELTTFVGDDDPEVGLV
jgi:hypothetical protein